MVKIKDLKNIIEQYKDEDDVGINIKGQVYDCYVYDDKLCRQQGHPCLVIAQE